MNVNSEKLGSPEKLQPLSALSRRALAFYRDNLRDKLEPMEEGKGIAIHPDSGDYVIAANPTYAGRAMRLRHPVGSYVTMRIVPSADFALTARIMAGRMASGQNP